MNEENARVVQRRSRLTVWTHYRRTDDGWGVITIAHTEPLIQVN